MLGCGAGHTVLALSRRGFDVSGIDISPEAIAWAREAVAASSLVADLRVGDVASLDSYPDESFRFVLDDYCLQCILGPSRPTCLAGVFRILTPAGAFHAGTERARDRPPAIFAPKDADYDPRSRCVIRDGIPYSYLTGEGEFERELATAGFHFRHTELRPLPGRPSYHAGRQWIDAVKPRSPT